MFLSQYLLAGNELRSSEESGCGLRNYFHTGFGDTEPVSAIGLNIPVTLHSIPSMLPLK